MWLCCRRNNLCVACGGPRQTRLSGKRRIESLVDIAGRYKTGGEGREEQWTKAVKEDKEDEGTYYNQRAEGLDERREE